MLRLSRVHPTQRSWVSDGGLIRGAQESIIDSIPAGSVSDEALSVVVKDVPPRIHQATHYNIGNARLGVVPPDT